MTYPLIGNYGICMEDMESIHPWPKALIVRECAKLASNFRNEMTLDEFLKKYDVPGISGIDTRHLTRILREYGVMNGMITTREDFDLDEVVKQLKEYKVQAYTKAEEIIAANPDGIMLSNGPGDPKECVEIIEELKKLFATNIPIFGICLGHQLMALANGADTKKMKYGHRGANHPVKDLKTGKVYISSQNHGYMVMEDSLNRDIAEVSFINVNDGTLEGVHYLGKNVMTVQFHPEACPGPNDSEFLFEEFINMMEVAKDA